MKELWERQLEDDLDWRMAEIAILKVQITRHKKGDLPYTSLLRALWAMLYAHYEGYCLYAFNIYLGQLERANVKRSLCKRSLILLSLEEEFRKFRGNTSTENCFKYFSVELNRLLEDQLVFERNPRRMSLS